jgi:hypothetical protein
MKSRREYARRITDAKNALIKVHGFLELHRVEILLMPGVRRAEYLAWIATLVEVDEILEDLLPPPPTDDTDILIV